MIKRWQKMLNVINRLIELVLIFASYFGSVAFWLLLIRHDPENIALQLSSAGWYAFFYAVLIVLCYQLVGLYDSVRARPIGNEIRWVLSVNALITLLGAALLYVFRLTNFSRGVISPSTLSPACSSLANASRCVLCCRFTAAKDITRSISSSLAAALLRESIWKQSVAPQGMAIP
jgi:uncharacterized membrane protein